MGNKNVIEVYADFIYHVPIGDKNKIEQIKDILTDANVEKYIEYLSLKSIIPLASHKEILEKKRNQVIRLDPIVEEAQAHVFAYYDIPDSYMLVQLKYIDDSYILTFPRFVMIDGNNPQKGLLKEFSRLSKHRLDAILYNTVKLIAVIGSKKDSVLYVSKLTNSTKRLSFDNNVHNLLKFLQDSD